MFASISHNGNVPEIQQIDEMGYFYQAPTSKACSLERSVKSVDNFTNFPLFYASYIPLVQTNGP
jgi:hypothetical protein